jgi:hypothetical protein
VDPLTRTRRGTHPDMTRLRSSRALTQDKTPNAMHASELVARIGGGDKSNNQLDDDGERGRGSGRKRQRQQQHGRALAVNFGKMANDDEGTTEATTFAPRQRPIARRPNRASGTAATRHPKLRRCQPAADPIARRGHPCRAFFFGTIRYGKVKGRRYRRKKNIFCAGWRARLRIMETV